MARIEKRKGSLPSISQNKEIIWNELNQKVKMLPEIHRHM